MSNKKPVIIRFINRQCSDGSSFESWIMNNKVKYFYLVFRSMLWEIKHAK